MNNNKIFFLALTLIATAACIAGCGSNKDTAKMTTTSGEIIDADQAPEMIETGSKTIVSNQSENDVANVETLEAPTTAPQEDGIPLATPTTPETPATSEPLQPNADPAEQYDENAMCYGTGNFEDYWIGEDYFDLVPYMEDNGFEVIETDIFCEALEDGERPENYYCCYGDRYAIGIGNGGFLVQDRDEGIIYYIEYCEETGRMVDIGECSAYISDLWALPVAIYNIKNGSDNPLLGLDESYTVITY